MLSDEVGHAALLARGPAHPAARTVHGVEATAVELAPRPTGRRAHVAAGGPDHDRVDPFTQCAPGAVLVRRVGDELPGRRRRSSVSASASARPRAAKSPPTSEAMACVAEREGEDPALGPLRIGVVPPARSGRGRRSGRRAPRRRRRFRTRHRVRRRGDALPAAAKANSPGSAGGISASTTPQLWPPSLVARIRNRPAPGRRGRARGAGRRTPCSRRTRSGRRSRTRASRLAAVGGHVDRGTPRRPRSRG